MANDPVHLIERAAERLRGAVGLPAPDTAATSTVTSPILSNSGAEVPSAAMVDKTDGVDAPIIRAHETLKTAVVTMARLANAGMVVMGKRARPSEEYRIAASNVLRTMPPRSAAGANMLMVTSPKPNEGKSFSALNLAISIAQNGLSQVLLVDADPKVGSVTSLLGLSDLPGLFDFTLSSDISDRAAVVTTEIPGLAIVPLGSNRALLAERGITRPVAIGIERLCHKFPKHLIILDAPPCLATSDPSMLATIAGQIVMVVEAERTQRDALVAALNLVRACKAVTLLLNKTRVAKTHSFGDYHYYGS